MARRIHLVGTTYTGSPDAVIAQSIKRFGDHLESVPEETSRPNWVIEMIEARATNPYLRTVRHSRFSEPRALRPILDPPRYMVRRGHTLTAADLDLPYAAEAAISAPIIAELAPRLRPQYGIPGPLNVAAFSWLRPLAYYDLEAKAAQEQVEAIHKLTGSRALYQLEIPLETVAVAKAPRSQQVRVARAMARRACDFIAGTPSGSEWVIHLCVGNKNDEPLVNLSDTSPLVHLANALLEYWPADQILHGVHFPLGSSRNPVPTGLAYYTPLGDLALPRDVHLLAGFVRADVRTAESCWDQWVDQHRQARDHIEAAADRGELGMSTPCGWRRQPGAAHSTTQLLLAMTGD